MKYFLVLLSVFAVCVCAAEKKKEEEKKVFQRLIPADVLRGKHVKIFVLYLCGKMAKLACWRDTKLFHVHPWTLWECLCEQQTFVLIWPIVYFYLLKQTYLLLLRWISLRIYCGYDFYMLTVTAPIALSDNQKLWRKWRGPVKRIFHITFHRGLWKTIKLSRRGNQFESCQEKKFETNLRCTKNNKS